MSTSDSKGGAITHDEGKTDWSLAPMDAFDAICRVLQQASTRKVKPYPRRNWEKGMEYSRVFACLMRHARDYARGLRTDPETGLPVMAHLAFRAIQLLTYEIRGIGTDDMGGKQ